MERLHPNRKRNRFPDGQQQQAISIYFFLEGLGFRGFGFRGLGFRVKSGLEMGSWAELGV